MKLFGAIFIAIFGVVLPFATLAFEYWTALSATEYFDPIPTIWHIAVVAMVPLLNLAALISCFRNAQTPARCLGFLTATAFFVSLLYTLPYLPLIPIAVPAILFYGLGFLPLTPLLAALSTLMVRRRLKARGLTNESGRVPGVLQGFATVSVLVLLLEFQPVITNIGLALASSEEPSRSASGISLLRLFGNDEIVLSECYSRQGRMVDPLSTMLRTFGSSRMTSEHAREVYFRVTGAPYNSVPPPRNSRRRQMSSMWLFDANRGGRQIGDVITGLRLLSSTIGGSIDGEAALGYTEWTMVLKNDSEQQQEARTHLALPPGGIVSRLTLWIDGEEREATFAARGKVSQAYQAVVAQRRDPVLVTTDGPGRVLLQLFPVLPSGGTMKVRLGVTAPLQIGPRREPIFTLPSFRDRNFEIAPTLEHSVWLESRLSAVPQGMALEAMEQNNHTFTFQGSLSTAQLSEGAIVFPPLSLGATSVSEDLREPAMQKIVQRLEALPAAPRNKVIAVIDASKALEHHRADIEQALNVFREHSELTIILASDQVPHRSYLEPKVIRRTSKSFSEEVRDALEAVPWTGGQDDTPALARAVELARGEGNAILWFHGPQPLESPAAQETLLQAFERMRTLPELYDLELVPGANHLVESLDRLHVLRRPSLQRDALTALLEQLAEGTTSVVMSRQRIPAGSVAPESAAHPTSTHLARLWAADEVNRMLASPEKNASGAATVIAAAYGIVTPLSGAVVLETAQQYQQAGLAPADPLNQDSVPTIPEPETYAMVGISGLLLLWIWKRERQRGPWLPA